MYYTKHIAPSHMVSNLINIRNVSINPSWHNASPIYQLFMVFLVTHKTQESVFPYFIHTVKYVDN